MLIANSIRAIPVLGVAADGTRAVVEIVIRHRAALFGGFAALFAVAVPPSTFSRVGSCGQVAFDFQGFAY